MTNRWLSSDPDGSVQAGAFPRHRAGFVVDAAALALLTLLVLRPLALTNLIPGSGDAFDYFIPYRAYASYALLHGHIPLWNPYLFMGVPFLANSQAAVLYPLHWPLAFLSPGRAVAWSMVLHVYLLAVFTYLYARLSARLSRPSAVVAGSVFAFGGFVAGAAMHLNQLNALAWFPLALLLWDVAMDRRVVGTALLGVVVAMMVLAGHTQATYIAMVGLALYGMWAAGGDAGSRRETAKRLMSALSIYAGAVFIGALLSAAQLLPTMELARYSLRQGGLTYRQAVSFSLRPTKLLWSLLPPYGVDLAQKFGTPAFSEYVAYLPIAGWVLFVVGARSVIGTGGRRREQGTGMFPLPKRLFYPTIAFIGFLLAMGGYDPLYYLFYKAVPGFDLFRAPARWMFLSSFGLAITAGIGLDEIGHLAKRWTRATRWLVWLVVAAELGFAIRAMPISHPTAPQALESVRNPTAYLLSARGAPGRILSISDTRYDPGDLSDLKQAFGPYLTHRGLYDLIVDTKEKEILAPNLSLYFRLQTVDGYDGGLLPLKRYNEMLRLFLPPDEIVPDGRLREQLKRIPPQRLLDLLNVEYVITDKVYDKWIDGRYYDLQQVAEVGPGLPLELKALPREPLTHIGVVWSGDGGEARAVSAEGRAFRWQISAAESREIDLPGGGKAWLSELAVSGGPTPLRQIAVLGSAGGLRVHGITVWDQRIGAHWALSLPRPADLERVFSGNVKIYRNRTSLPRACVVYRAETVSSDEEALAALSREDFDPAQEVVLSSPAGSAEERYSAIGGESPESRAEIALYEPEHVVVRVHSEAPGYLVLSDTFYPGWKALLDGKEARILRANLLFRAVHVSAGDHTVEFSYRPRAWKFGEALSLFALAAMLLGALIVGLRAKLRQG